MRTKKNKNRSTLWKTWKEWIPSKCSKKSKKRTQSYSPTSPSRLRSTASSSPPSRSRRSPQSNRSSHQPTRLKISRKSKAIKWNRQQSKKLLSRANQSLSGKRPKMTTSIYSCRSRYLKQRPTRSRNSRRASRRHQTRPSWSQLSSRFKCKRRMPRTSRSNLSNPQISVTRSKYSLSCQRIKW